MSHADRQLYLNANPKRTHPSRATAARLLATNDPNDDDQSGSEPRQGRFRNKRILPDGLSLFELTKGVLVMFAINCRTVCLEGRDLSSPIAVSAL